MPRTFQRIDLPLVSPRPEAPAGDGWLHEVKNDGRRLVAHFDGAGGLHLISRNGFDRTTMFRAPFDPILADVRHDMILDGEIAVPDERGVTHITDLQDALYRKQPERLAFFAFDLVQFDGRDLRRQPVEDRKALLQDVLGPIRGGRVLYVDHVVGCRAELFEQVRAIGAEGIVLKRLGSPYRGGRSSDWLKTKVSEIGEFAIVGFVELGDGRLDGLAVAEEGAAGALEPRGLVKFGFAGLGLWQALDVIRTGRRGAVASCRSTRCCRPGSSSSAATRPAAPFATACCSGCRGCASHPVQTAPANWWLDRRLAFSINAGI